jgi:hypothetical protein
MVKDRHDVFVLEACARFYLGAKSFDPLGITDSLQNARVQIVSSKVLCKKISACPLLTGSCSMISQRSPNFFPITIKTIHRQLHQRTEHYPPQTEDDWRDRPAFTRWRWPTRWAARWTRRRSACAVGAVSVCGGWGNSYKLRRNDDCAALIGCGALRTPANTRNP